MALKHNDILSSHICTICWGKIDEFHVYYKTVEKSHKEFQKVQQDLDIIKEEDSFLNTNSIKQEEIDEEDFMNINKELQLEIEIDYDDSDTTKNPLADNEPQCADDTDVDSNDGNDNNSSFSLEKQTRKTDVKNKKDSTNRKHKIKDKPKRPSRKNTEKIENNVEPKRKKAVFNRLDPLHTEEMIKKHIPMGCNLCVFVGKTFGDIVIHFKDEHPDVRAYITCCDKTFTKRFYVAQHAMTHENPDCFR